MYLSKSDFKIAQDCPTKLYYKKLKYPSLKDEDEYLQLLAEGGFMVEKMCKLLYPEGREVGFDGPPEEAFCATMEALKVENVTLFEATLISDGKLARVDILKKTGRKFRLIEVKAKSYDSREDRECRANGYVNIFRTKDGGIDSKWCEYLEDVTYQVMVLKELFPDHTVNPFLAMPDKSKTTKIDRLYSLFRLRRVQQPGAFHERIVVDYLGDPEELRRNHFITEVSVAAEVEYLAEEVQLNAAKYLASLRPKLSRIVTPLTTACAKCEYHAIGNDARDGFRECWGAMADVKPHILDLYFASDIGRANGVTADELISRRKVSLLDIPEGSLLKKDGSVGERSKRQRIQILHTRHNTEWINPRLGKLLRSFRYPLKFIDFETSALAVPYHAGMRPYEQVAFQWSCHTIEGPGAPLVHQEWINVVDAFPNFGFAKTLMEAIGTTGTVFMYATHENTILTAILNQMSQRRHRDPELARWLEIVTENGWLVDMNQIVLKNYFHPLMKGRTSIKKVLDANWKTNSELRERYPQYLRMKDGEILSPYQALPPLIIHGEDVVVAEGTGAMRAYEAMMYGFEKDDPDIREKWKRLLLQYCKLDTLAMVMLWQHWLGCVDSR